jgi:N-formylglutamate deformylase
MTTASGGPFEVLAARGPRHAVVAHVPHAATLIPAPIRREIMLDDAALAQELVRLTDWHVDALFSGLLTHGIPMFVNRLSRLVFDPERFADDATEPMARVGQGAVYTHTTDGRPLRSMTDRQRNDRITQFYVPYHAAFTALVTDTVERFGHCHILDCHSFASDPLPSEPDQNRDRPDICIGTDRVHTPPDLAEALRQALDAEGWRVRVDAPFAGSIVPLAYYERADLVTSVMIEVRRGLYCDERTGQPTPPFAAVQEHLERAILPTLPVQISGPAITT